MCGSISSMLKSMLNGMQILSKYDEDAETAADHDVLMVCAPSPDTMSAEDVAKLDELHWRWGGEHWPHFT